MGRALAIELTGRGYGVAASARNINSIQDLSVFKKISLDVTSEEQIRKAVDECGDIDILINNAAYTVAGPIEVIPLKEIRKEYETNVIGPLRLIRAFVPGMRQAGEGTIVNISSVADRFSPPYGGSYSSAKAALAMMSEALYFELKHFGIKVMLVEAGSIKTDMPLKQEKFSSAEYKPLDDQMKKRFEDFLREDRRNPAEDIAKIIADKIEYPDPGLRVAVGKDAEYMISLRSKLSDSEWEKSAMFQDLKW